MTARSTRELTMVYWPRLGSFPTTQAFVAAVIGLDYATFAAWFIIALVLILRAKDGPELGAAILTARTAIPDGWLLFLTGLHAGGVAQFGIKRKTHRPELEQGGSAPPATS